MFISKAGKEGQLCLWHNNPTGVIYVLIVFLLLLFATPSPTLSKTLLLCKSAPRILFSLLVRDQSRQSRAGAHLVRLGGQSEHGIRFTLPTSVTGNMIRPIILDWKGTLHSTHKMTFSEAVETSVTTTIIISPPPPLLPAAARLDRTALELIFSG